MRTPYRHLHHDPRQCCRVSVEFRHAECNLMSCVHPLFPSVFCSVVLSALDSVGSYSHAQFPRCPHANSPPPPPPPILSELEQRASKLAPDFNYGQMSSALDSSRAVMLLPAFWTTQCSDQVHSIDAVYAVMTNTCKQTRRVPQQLRHTVLEFVCLLLQTSSEISAFLVTFGPVL